MDELTCEDEVLRAFVVALLIAYYRVRPSDTRFEKAALAALPPAHRAMASAQLSQIVELTKRLARQAESERRRERGRDASAAPRRSAADHHQRARAELHGGR